MDALAAEAFLNAEHSVYGLRMRPLSLGHAFALEAIGSPLYEGREGAESDLLLAAWMCSRPPLAQLNCSGLRYDVWRWLAGKMDFAEQRRRWETYVGDYSAAPQFWKKQTSNKYEPSKIPNGISTVVGLMKLGMTESQAWATPVGAASWYQAASYEAESGNKVDIVTDSERIAILRQKARRAAKAKEAKDNG
jgi:hypothetical protein